MSPVPTARAGTEEQTVAEVSTEGAEETAEAADLSGQRSGMRAATAL